MTKKHYELIARTFLNTYGSDNVTVISKEYEASVTVNHPTVRLLAHQLADTFQLDNPKFDRAKFLEACGMEA